jgi:hypothetical protein
MLFHSVHSRPLQSQVYLLASATDYRSLDPRLHSAHDVVHSTVCIEARNAGLFHAQFHIRTNHFRLRRFDKDITSAWHVPCGVELVSMLSPDPDHHTASLCWVLGAPNPAGV